MLPLQRGIFTTIQGTGCVLLLLGRLLLPSSMPGGDGVSLFPLLLLITPAIQQQPFRSEGTQVESVSLALLAVGLSLC